MGISRADGNYLGAPDGETRINDDDVIILYGRAKVIGQLDQRKADAEGDRQHEDTVIEQKKVKIAEKEKDIP